MSKMIKRRIRDRRKALAARLGCGTEQKPALVLHLVDGKPFTALGFIGVETHRAVASFRAHFGQFPKRARPLRAALTLGEARQVVAWEDSELVSAGVWEVRK